jgi:hypothetical protein
MLQDYSFQPEQKQTKRFFGKMVHKDEHPYQYSRASCFVKADWLKQDVTRYRNWLPFTTMLMFCSAAR